MIEHAAEDIMYTSTTIDPKVSEELLHNAEQREADDNKNVG